MENENDPIDQEDLELVDQTDDSPVDDQPSDPTPPPAAPSVRDLLSKEGFDASSYDDDSAALSALVRQSQERQQFEQQLQQQSQLAQYGQEYLQHAGEFQQFLDARRQQAEPEPQKFEPPAYNPLWRTQIREDDKGNLIPANGGTLDTVRQYQEYQDWLNNFLSNPYQNLQGFIDQRAQEQAKSLLDERIQQVTDSLRGEMFISTNRDWLFDQQNQNQLTAKGQAFQGFLEEASRMNLSGKSAEDYAVHSLKRWEETESLKSQLAELQGGGKQAKPPADPKQDFLSKATGQGANSAGSTTTPANVSPEDAPLQNEAMSLAEQLRAELSKAGITDEQLAEINA